MNTPTEKVYFTSYTASFDDGICYTIFLFYHNGIWDEYKRLYDEAVEKYPPNKYQWIRLED